MPASNKEITRYHYIVLFLWLALTLLMAMYFITNRLALFDPNNKLLGKEGSDIIQSVREITALKNLGLSNTIIHFTNDSCSCTKYSEDHKAAIDEKAKLDGFTVININLPSELLTIIPSTPSILIMDDAEDLLYFGPYSAGLACSKSNGYVEVVLKNYSKGYNSNLILSDVKGCYCGI